MSSASSRGSFGFDVSARKPNVSSWARSCLEDHGEGKNYYFDSCGDRDNLAFGSLYRMDVARYKLKTSVSSNELYARSVYRGIGRSLVFDEDIDIDAQDDKIKAGGRYWSAKNASLERHRNLKRIRITMPNEGSTSVPSDFIPVGDHPDSGKVVDDELLSRVSVVDESWEDMVLRKTKEFNKMSREHPHNEKVWLAFAEFQDKVASMQPQKGARLQTLEKKISILEKAIELNPENEELISCLLSAYQSRDSAEVLIGRWEKILMQHSGSWRLWKEFLHIAQGEFSRFKVSQMRKIYANAIRALSSACSRQRSQAYRTADASSIDPTTVQLEFGLVDVFISLCRFEWQAGYQELATALFQAELDYSLFCPPLLLTEQSKQRLFEHFWNSDGARIGEEDAVGWSTWLEKEEQQRQKVFQEEPIIENEEGGWTGWSEPLSKSNGVGGISDIIDDDVALEEVDEELETRAVEEKDDTEALLKMLGIGSDTDPNVEVKDTLTWNRWSKEEISRESDQWMPMHANSGGVSQGDIRLDREGDDQLSRVVLFEDICEYLFSICSVEARLSLVFQFIDFYGGRLSKWACTNSSSWAGKTLSLDTVSDNFLENLRRIHDVTSEGERGLSNFDLKFHLDGLSNSNMRINKMKFIRNVTLLCLTAFPHNHVLDETILVSEELLHTKMDSCTFSVTPCRALAKSLIKSNRQDVLLCGVYARREAAYGNIDHARKVFDMALTSIEGLPLELRSTTSLLYFWYAEVEYNSSSVCGSDSILRAIYILCCFGSDVKYTPYKTQASSLQQLRARQGFKERIRLLRSTWSRGVTDDCSASIICSAALFEELTTGCAAGIEVLNQAFSMVLPERRTQSPQLEYMFNYYMRMLWRHRTELGLSKIWESITQGLQLYPLNPELYDALVEIGHFHTAPNKVRRMFDEYSQRNPSVTVSLFALSFEMRREGSQHRIRRLFERALGNEKLRSSTLLWRWYIAYESDVARDPLGARRAFFRAIHACPWSKRLWLDGFAKLHEVLTAKELSDLQEVMRDKELNLRTDIYEILLQDEIQL